MAYVAINLLTLYCLILGLMCDLGYGSRGINKQIMSHQILPRVYYIIVMFMFEVPIILFKLTRRVTIDDGFNDIDPTDEASWNEYIQSGQIRELDRIDIVLNFMYLGLGIFIAIYTMRQPAVWYEFKRILALLKVMVCKKNKKETMDAFQKSNRVYRHHHDSRMQFLTQHVNNMYACAAIEGVIQSLKDEITDFWTPNQPRNARNETKNIAVLRIETLDPKIFERTNPTDFQSHHVQLQYEQTISQKKLYLVKRIQLKYQHIQNVMLRETTFASDKDSILNPAGNHAFNFDGDVNSYTKLVNTLFNQNNKKLVAMRHKMSITSYCPLYFRSLREIDKLDDSELMRSLSHEFNYNKLFTCDLKAMPNKPERTRFYFHTHDHKYKLVQISKRERVNCLNLLQHLYEHIRSGTQSDSPSSQIGYQRKERFNQCLLQRIYGIHRIQLRQYGCLSLNLALIRNKALITHANGRITMVQEISGNPLRKQVSTHQQLRHLLHLSKQSTMLKMVQGYEHLNLIMEELKPDMPLAHKRELLKALFRDIDFLCAHGVTGYKVEIMVEENLNDKMLNMFNN